MSVTDWEEKETVSINMSVTDLWREGLSPST